jgi:hypothetical protein
MHKVSNGRPWPVERILYDHEMTTDGRLISADLLFKPLAVPSANSAVSCHKLALHFATAPC